MNGQTVAVGAGSTSSAVAVAWGWSLAFPEHPMPTEVAASIAPMIAAAIGLIGKILDRRAAARRQDAEAEAA